MEVSLQTISLVFDSSGFSLSIISALCVGGECGPRAWFGRFSCKAFGIPTWGVRQPGHAAMTHWTPKGWVVCLGAGWPFCTWDGRCGPDFFLESQARVNEDRYFKTVLRVEFLADLLGEGALDASTGLVDSACLWRSLALMQKIYLSATFTGYNVLPSPVETIVARRLAEVEKQEELSMDGQKIIIPAASCSCPRSSSDKVIFMPSFLGGKQLNIREEATLEYTLTGCKSETYELSMRVCTVHLKQDPLIFSINNDSDSVGIANINIPYTTGTWEYTNPVVVELAEGTNILSFTRQNKEFGGLTIKDITLTPQGTGQSFSARALDTSTMSISCENKTEELLSSFSRHPVENQWHQVKITKEGNALRWTNEAGVSWLMQKDSTDRNVLKLGADCPYFSAGQTVVNIKMDAGIVVALLFQGELYTKNEDDDPEIIVL